MNFVISNSRSLNEFNFVCVIVRGILSNVTEGLLWCNDMVRRASSRDFIQRNATVQLVHNSDADKMKISTFHNKYLL